MNRNEFARWLRNTIGQLGCVPAGERDYIGEMELAESLLRQAGEYATKLGLSDAYRRCQVRKPTLVDATEALSFCLGQVRNEDGPFTVAETAERLNISERTVYDLVDSGDLQCSRYGKGGGAIRITLEHLQAYQHRDEAPRFRHV